MSESAKKPSTFEEIARDADGGGLVGDFFAFVRESAKWWLIPIAVVFGLVGILLILAQTGLAPFIYALF